MVLKLLRNKCWNFSFIFLYLVGYFTGSTILRKSSDYPKFLPLLYKWTDNIDSIIFGSWQCSGISNPKKVPLIIASLLYCECPSNRDNGRFGGRIRWPLAMKRNHLKFPLGDYRRFYTKLYLAIYFHILFLQAVFNRDRILFFFLINGFQFTDKNFAVFTRADIFFISSNFTRTFYLRHKFMPSNILTKNLYSA